MGLLFGLLRGVQSSGSSFDPNTLLAAGQYGDFMRVSESAPASSGGLLTRWAGLRVSADSNMRFDVTPFGSSPAVGAYGPNGEPCIRMSSGENLVGSVDRGGAGSLYLPGPGVPQTNSLTGNGFTLALRAKFSGTGDSTIELTIKDAASAQFELVTSGGVTTLKFPTFEPWPVAVAHDHAPTVTVTDLNVYGFTFAPGGTLKMFLNGALLNTWATAANTSLERWLVQHISGAVTMDVPAYFLAHTAISDDDMANLHLWMEG